MFRKTSMVTVVAALAVVAAGTTSSSAESRPAGAADRVIYQHHHKDGGSPCEGLDGCTFVQLKGDPETGPSEAMFTLKAGTPFSPHWHTSPEHVVGVSGVMLWHVKGHPTYRVGAGDYLYYPSKAVHWGKCAPGADCVYYVYDSKPYDFHPAGR
ncbi:cupin domain-containing protein [Sphaerisporangium fuscum]|uniref:cupin domain-containing protein n=1 Tax=Sphaerisporangium fuscum TaxID=2835868 RepID=UPI001BDD1911|nr:cupin domain-containing protein [Sphaerisporangium fuscum]